MQTEITKAKQALSLGKTILYPTDTIWGIGCDATNKEAVSNIYTLKNRIESKALICLVSDIDMLQTYIEQVPETAIQFIKNAQTPTTIIYSNPKRIAANLIAQDNTLAIRVVSHGFAHELIKSFNKPIVSTSANISNQPSPKSFKEISSDILKGVDYVVNLQDEKSEVKPSTIIKIDLDGDIQIIRK